MNEPRGRGGVPRYLERALTPAERQRLYRERRKGKVPKVDPLARLRAATAAFRAEIGYFAEKDAADVYNEMAAAAEELLEKR